MDDEDLAERREDQKLVDETDEMDISGAVTAGKVDEDDKYAFPF
jgi:hypothetical protein